jgi:hypothetical protein
MPIHDWTRVDAGLFHAFHQSWAVRIQDALNDGVLPADYLALVEQRIRGPIPDVLTVRLPPPKRKPAGGVATAPAPAARTVRRGSVKLDYANKASRVSVRHRHGDVVAVIEIVSPGNKETATAARGFVTKAADVIGEGVSLLIVDLFPPGKHDPDRLHEAIWAEVGGGDTQVEAAGEFPPAEPVTLVSFDATGELVMYAEAAAVGGALPDMPVFLRPGLHVPVPLDRTYAATWKVFPAALKELLEDPA